MSRAAPGRKQAHPGRRYLVHLSCAIDVDGKEIHYVVRIRPWCARSVLESDALERIFASDCELIRTINPLLPHGSDVRDIFEHIESPSGFFYLLYLSREQVAQLSIGSRCLDDRDIR